MNDEAVTLTNLIYHKYFEGAQRQYQIAQGYDQLINRYHVSKQKMISTATNYVYRKNICIELECRSTKILKRYAEHGIELYQSKIKPRVAFRKFTGSDDADQCTQKKN